MPPWHRLLPATLAAMALALTAPAQTPNARMPTTPQNLLLPQPASTTYQPGTLPLTANLQIASNRPTDDRLQQAIRQTINRTRQRTGLQINPDTPNTSSPNNTFAITVAAPAAPIQTLNEDESYTLTINAAGIHLDAPTTLGALHGLRTFEQLLQPDTNGTTLPYLTIPFLTIKDQPRFPWRGLMLDCVRHFEPVDVLKRTLDGMAAVKLNVFHWHLTDDQGFRIQSLAFPRLTEKGSDGLFYTQQDARDIIAYAHALGIRVVPEFEMPGHSVAWLVAYPELASGPPPTGIRREFGISDAALDPTREETYTFLNRFLTEMSALFPDSYIHIGGDETESPDWKSNPRILAFMRAHQLADSPALQAYFNGRVLKILTANHKHLVGWDEVLNPALPKDVLVQSWRGQKSLVAGAQQGYQGLLSAGYYLDAMQSAEDLYRVDPLPAASPLTPAQQALILGGELCLFAEQIDQRSVDSRLWPRAAAVAERFWSPSTVTDTADLYRRLPAASLQLEALGLTHLTHTEAALRALTDTPNSPTTATLTVNPDLRTLTTVLEPVSFHERYEQQKTSQLTVLNHLVDALPPDPPSRYTIAAATERFLQSPATNTKDAAALIQTFQTLLAAAPGAARQIQQSPLLADAATRAAQLPPLATLALQAIHSLQTDTPTPTGWKSQAATLLTAARQPSAILRFTFLDPLTKLVAATKP